MFFKRKKSSSCEDWIDSILGKNVFRGIQSINFNIYEGEGSFHLQIIGSESTPEQDEEWYCDNHFTTGENVFIIDRKIAGDNWQDGFKYFINVVNSYLEKGKNKDKLKNMKAVGIGFVDGDNEKQHGTGQLLNKQHGTGQLLNNRHSGRMIPYEISCERIPCE